MVSVDVKHHVYLLLETTDRDVIIITLSKPERESETLTNYYYYYNHHHHNTTTTNNNRVRLKRTLHYQSFESSVTVCGFQ